MSYNDVALGNAQQQKLTSVEVQAMGYSKIAELADVELGPNGESPADFFYQQVRTFVVTALLAEEQAKLVQDEDDLLKSALKQMPETISGKKLKKKDVYRNEDGEIVLR